jgi:hypothetical protein
VEGDAVRIGKVAETLASEPCYLPLSLCRQGKHKLDIQELVEVRDKLHRRYNCLLGTVSNCSERPVDYTRFGVNDATSRRGEALNLIWVNWNSTARQSCLVIA